MKWGWNPSIFKNGSFVNCPKILIGKWVHFWKILPKEPIQWDGHHCIVIVMANTRPQTRVLHQNGYYITTPWSPLCIMRCKEMLPTSPFHHAFVRCACNYLLGGTKKAQGLILPAGAGKSSHTQNCEPYMPFDLRYMEARYPTCDWPA